MFQLRVFVVIGGIEGWVFVVFFVAADILLSGNISCWRLFRLSQAGLKELESNQVQQISGSNLEDKVVLFQYSHKGSLWWMVNHFLQRIRGTEACWITSNVCYLCKGWSRLGSGVRLCFGQLVCGRNMQCCFRRLRKWQLGHLWISGLGDALEVDVGMCFSGYLGVD